VETKLIKLHVCRFINMFTLIRVPIISPMQNKSNKFHVYCDAVMITSVRSERTVRRRAISAFARYRCHTVGGWFEFSHGRILEWAYRVLLRRNYQSFSIVLDILHQKTISKKVKVWILNKKFINCICVKKNKISNLNKIKSSREGQK